MEQIALEPKPAVTTELGHDNYIVQCLSHALEDICRPQRHAFLLTETQILNIDVTTNIGFICITELKHWQIVFSNKEKQVLIYFYLLNNQLQVK